MTYTLFKVVDMTRLKLPVICSCWGRNIEPGERVSGENYQEWFHCVDCRSGGEAARRAVVKASIAAFVAILAGGVVSQALFKGRSDQTTGMTIVGAFTVTAALALFAIFRRSLRHKHPDGEPCPGFGVRIDAPSSGSDEALACVLTVRRSDYAESLKTLNASSIVVVR